jgi:L-threonylcarbamoyladenylate synthase
METKIVKVDPFQPDDSLLRPCAEALRAGKTVAFPTETVYGLGANALMPDAVERVFQAKGRPQDNPLIVHVSRLESVPPLVLEVGEGARRLMHMFWPGPLTLLFPKSDVVPDHVTAGLPSVGIRMPDHPVAQRLLDMAGVPIAAPSANISGSPSPTTAEAVIADLYGKVDFIVDGGNAEIGVESTVLDLSTKIPRVLRPGGLSVEELSSVLGPVEVFQFKGVGPAPSPGMKYRHYAPKGSVSLAMGSPLEQARSIIAQAVSAVMFGQKVAVLASSENLPRYEALRRALGHSLSLIELGPRTDLAPVASRLFSGLRYADSLGASVILAESFPDQGLGLAIQNRLGRASGGKTLPTTPTLDILMVCTGNTCRSPMAEVIFRHAWEELGAPYPVNVFSRGTSAITGMAATDEAVLAAKGLGLDLSYHEAGRVSPSDLAKANIVIAMARSHKDALLARFPQFASKVYTLSELVPEVVKGDVVDPIGLGQAVYDKTARLLKDGLTELASRLAGLRRGHIEDSDR